MQKIVVLGALSAVAQQVERQMAQHRMELLLVGRSMQRLQILRQDLLLRGARQVEVFAADLAQLQQHPSVLAYVREKMPEMDTLLLAYGSLLDTEKAQRQEAMVVQQIFNDCISAAALLTSFAEDFEARRRGCIAAITSVAGDRGRASNYVYGAAKGGLAIFLSGLRARLYPCGVRVLTIKPGPIDTPMTAHLPQHARFAQPELVARDIFKALQRRRPDVLYTPFYWAWIMRLIRVMPESWFKRLPEI